MTKHLSIRFGGKGYRVLFPARHIPDSLASLSNTGFTWAAEAPRFSEKHWPRPFAAQVNQLNCSHHATELRGLSWKTFIASHSVVHVKSERQKKAQTTSLREVGTFVRFRKLQKLSDVGGEETEALKWLYSKSCMTFNWPLFVTKELQKHRRIFNTAYNAIHH